MKIIKWVWGITVQTLKTTWYLLKQMKDWKGILILLVVWLILSGAGLFGLGWLLKINTLKYIGGLLIAASIGPFPLMPATVGVATLIKGFIFRDPNMSWTVVVEQFKKSKIGYKEGEDNNESNGKNP